MEGNTCPSHPPHLYPEGLRQADPRLRGSVQSPAHGWSPPPRATPMSQRSAGTPAFHAPLGHKSLEIRGSGREPEPLTACPPLPGAPAAYSARAQVGDGSQGGTSRRHETREGAAASGGEQRSLTGTLPSPRLASQQQPQENRPPAPSAQGGDWGPGSPPGAHEAAPICPSSAQNQPHTGKPGAGTHRRPQACPQACSELQGTWADKLMAASLLRRQEAANSAPPRRTAPPAGRPGRGPGARLQAAQAGKGTPAAAQPHPCKPRRRLRQRRAPPQGLHCPPEDSQGRVREVGVPQAAGPGRRGSRQLRLSSTVLGLKSSSPRSLGPQFCMEAGARGVSPFSRSTCPSLKQP